MKRYRYGESHGISPEELEYVEVVEPMVEGYGVVKKEEEKVTTLLSVDARIIPSSLPSLQAEDQNAISAKPSARLYLRIQQWTLPLFHPFTSFSTLTTALKSFSPIYSVCEHFAVQDRVGGPHAFRSDRCYWPRSDGEIDHGNLSPLTEKVIEEYSVRNGNKEESKPVFHYCERCGVDFELEVRNIEEHGQFSGHKRRRAFVITKNLDLSPSHSLNRPSIQYDKGQMSENLLEFLADRHSIPFKAGEAKKAFENAEGELEKEDLCERNAGLLRGRKYKRVLGEWKPKIWILQAGRKVPSRAPDFPWNRWGIALVITTAVEICWIVFSANNIGRMIDSLCVDRGFLGTGCWVCKGEWEAWVILVGAVLVAEVGWVLATTTKRDLRRILLILGHDGLSDTWPWDRDEHGWLI